MKLLILLAFFVSVHSNASPRTKTFYSINSRGSLYLTPNESQLPSKLWLSVLGVQAGTIIGIKQVGSFQYFQGSEETSATALVFVDANDNYMYPGPRSTTYQAFTFPDVAGDVSIENGYQHGVEVPEGAVAVLIAPTDPYTLDNEDLDGDYGVEIELPYLFPFDVRIFQSGVTSVDTTGDGKVDLIPGAQANVVAYMTRYTDAGQSTLVWRNDLSGQSFTLLPTAPISGPGRELEFAFFDVPDSSDYSGLNTLIITLRDSNGVLLSEKNVHINVLPAPTIEIRQGGILNPGIEGDGIVDLLPALATEITVVTNLAENISNSRIVLKNSVSQQELILDTAVPMPKGIATFVVFSIPATAEFKGLWKGTLFLKDENESLLLRKLFTINVKDPFEFKIFQVIENPKLGLAGSDLVDLVAGKNADIELAFDTSAGVTDGAITFKNAGIVVPTNYQFFLVEPGKGNIQINPVPAGSTLLNTEMKIELKNAQGDIIFERSTFVNIRRTKTIKVGFVPFSGCISVTSTCFSGPTFEEAKQLAKQGGEIMQAMYPVGESNFDSSYVLPAQRRAKIRSLVPPASIDDLRMSGNYDMLDDLSALDKEMYLKKLAGEVSHFIGVVNSNYFSYRYNPGDFGIANFNLPANQVIDEYSALVRSDAPLTLPHEIGHLFGINHHGDKAYGYSNYSLPAYWGYPRGHTGEKISLMKGETPVSGTANVKWIASDDYISIFKQNLFDPVGIETRRSTLGIRVNGYFESNGMYKVTNTYLVENLSSIENPNGEFFAKTLDSDFNVISVVRSGSGISSEGGIKTLSFNIGIPVDAVFTDIYKDVSGEETFLARIVIPADILKEEIKYIPEEAINLPMSEVREKLSNLIANYRLEILRKRYKYAQQILSNEIIPFLNLSLTDNFTPVGVEAGKEVLNSVAMSSLIRLNAATVQTDEPFSPFLRLELKNSAGQNEKSKLAVLFLKNPNNRKFEFELKVWIDGYRVKTVLDGINNLAESPKLTQGDHQWTVQSYVIDAGLKRTLNESIEEYRLRKYQLEKELETETDLEKRHLILVRIQRCSKRITELKNQLENALISMGDPLTLDFEVL